MAGSNTATASARAIFVQSVAGFVPGSGDCFMYRYTALAPITAASDASRASPAREKLNAEGSSELAATLVNSELATNTASPLNQVFRSMEISPRLVVSTLAFGFWLLALGF